ncbi:hypothetical protein [Brumicola pallidula]|jgi:hypothetical protein|uniref:Uncharacterized protein n=1 Tax=Brumicola pallidula DSM 14239 = ACAM 615 TaxID=1121922 RepID=K6ZVE5_9ALTE|nr:hypothetical protein [Glaciecola pallidula]GAC27290.1 hypothetical protein GPAL_0410 [Glaciecola pallidula DSM 14239 = ACAM 615]
MFTEVALLAIIVQLGIIVGIIVYAVKLLNRITDIAGSQKSIANSQIQLISLLIKKQENQESSDS